VLGSCRNKVRTIEWKEEQVCQNTCLYAHMHLNARTCVCVLGGVASSEATVSNCFMALWHTVRSSLVSGSFTKTLPVARVLCEASHGASHGEVHTCRPPRAGLAAARHALNFGPRSLANSWPLRSLANSWPSAGDAPSHAHKRPHSPSLTQSSV